MRLFYNRYHTILFAVVYVNLYFGVRTKVHLVRLHVRIAASCEAAGVHFCADF